MRPLRPFAPVAYQARTELAPGQDLGDAAHGAPEPGDLEPGDGAPGATAPGRTAPASVPVGPDAGSPWTPGDLVLTHGSALTSKLIRFGQRLRIRGDDRQYTHWNHAAIVVDRDGAIIEALGRGIVETHVSKYGEEERLVLTVAAGPDDREQVVRFCRWAAGQVEPDGTPLPDGGTGHRYGWAQILSIGLTVLTGARFTFSLDGTQICSGLAGRALERTGAIFNRPPSHLMPADLAKYFDPLQEAEPHG